METETTKKAQALMDKELIKILLVEDDAVDSQLVKQLLTSCSRPLEFAVESVGSLPEAIECLTNREYDIVIADMGLPDSSGIETVQKLKLVIPDTPIVVLTGMGDEEMGLSAIRNGASDYLIKDLPLNILLVRTIIYALERSSVEGEVRELKQQLEFILGATKTGVDIIDSEFNIRYINSEWKKVYGDPSGKKCYEYFMDRSEVCPGCGIVKALKTKKLVVTEEVLAKEGNRPIQVTTIPFQDEKKEWLVAEVNVDITDRKKAEDEIKDLAKFPEENPNPVYRVSKDGILLYANSASRRLILEDQTKIGDKIPEKWIGMIKNVYDSGTRQQVEVELSGRIFLFEQVPVIEGGYVNSYTIDITERKKVEEKLSKAAEEWQRTFDSIADLVFIQDKDFNIIKANKAFAEAIKSKPEDIIGKKCYEVVHNMNSPWPDCPFKESKRDKKPHTCEVDDPNIGVPLLVSTFPTFDDKGEVVGSAHIAKDITKQKKATELLFDTNLRLQETSQKLFNAKKELEKKNAALEKAQEVLEKQVEERTSELIDANKTLQNAEANLRMMINQNADSILIIDHKGIIRFVNNTAKLLFGRKKEELIGETFGFIVAKDEISEIEVVRKKGEVVTAEIRTVEIKWKGEMVYLASLRDITERRKAEKLEETMKTKSEFISTVSHELRTPLTAIIAGIAPVLDGFFGEINEEQKHLLGISKKNVDRLARLINDVLDFQKLDSAKMNFNLKPNDINQIVNDTYDIMASTAKNIGLDLLLELGQNLPKAKFDSDKITQALTNLVTNAMKFTEKGNVTIKTTKTEDAVQVSVSDTGCGIKKEDLPKVFNRFEQLGHGGERKTGGTGLGLAISKEIIERHGGRICVESKPAKGSKFTFTLPVVKGGVKSRRVAV